MYNAPTRLRCRWIWDKMVSEWLCYTMVWIWYIHQELTQWCIINRRVGGFIPAFFSSKHGHKVKLMTKVLHFAFPGWYQPPGMLLPQDTAKYLAEFTNAGSPCTTYWQYTDTQYTQSFGWYKYPPEAELDELRCGGFPSRVEQKSHGFCWGY